MEWNRFLLDISQKCELNASEEITLIKMFPGIYDSPATTDELLNEFKIGQEALKKKCGAVFKKLEKICNNLKNTKGKCGRLHSCLRSNYLNSKNFHELNELSISMYKEINYHIFCSRTEKDEKIVQDLKKEIESLNLGISVWLESTDAKKLIDKNTARYNSVQSCEVFSIVLSNELIENKNDMNKALEEFEWAYTRYERSKASLPSPKIIFLIKDIKDERELDKLKEIFSDSLYKNNKITKKRTSINELGIYDKTILKNLQKKQVEGEDKFNILLYEFISMILPSITFIDKLDRDNQKKWFDASQVPYENIFFPIESERILFGEIEDRIDSYNSQDRNEKEWHEVYAIWHLDINIEEYENLDPFIMGISYICVHLKSGWCFGNYLAIKPIFRNSERSKFLFNTCIEKIKTELNLVDLKGIIFEVEKIDFKFLNDFPITEKISGNNDEDKILAEFRKLRRLNLFLRNKNTYIFLKEDGELMFYTQPGMIEPVEENNVELILMIYLYDTTKIEEINTFEVISFVFENLFLSGSKNRPKNYQENVLKTKNNVLKELKKSGAKLGKIEEIKNDEIKNYQSFFDKFNRKVKSEKLQKKVEL